MFLKKHYKEILLYAVILTLGSYALIELDAFERVYEFSRTYEDWELDELLLTVLSGVVCLCIYALNRTRDVRRKSWELKRSREELSAAHEKLTDLTRAREEFMAVACHELKSPLGGIVNGLQLMEMADDEEERNESLGFAKTAAKGLTLLIDDVLLFSQLAHGEQGRNSFIPTEVFESVRLVAQLQADAKGLEFETILDDSVPPTVVGNEAGLRLVVLNLVGNGIKYTEHGGVAVHCSFRKDALRDELVIKVTDTGVGIPKKHLETIFDPYRTARDDFRKTESGIGLGLAIVHRLVERMNGTITVASTINQGSEFTVRIPVTLG